MGRNHYPHLSLFRRGEYYNQKQVNFFGKFAILISSKQRKRANLQQAAVSCIFIYNHADYICFEDNAAQLMSQNQRQNVWKREANVLIIILEFNTNPNKIACFITVPTTYISCSKWYRRRLRKRRLILISCSYLKAKWGIEICSMVLEACGRTLLEAELFNKLQFRLLPLIKFLKHLCSHKGNTKT